MEIKASAKNVRMSARKIRLVIDAVRGLSLEKALEQLKFINKLAAKSVVKLVDSAIANAVNNFELDRDNLYIKEIKADEGATAYRWMPRAHGRATPLRKKTSHISIVLAEVKDSGKKEAKKQSIEAPVKLGEHPKKDEGVKADKKEKTDEKNKDEKNEKGKKIIDPRSEGKGGHTKIEGGSHKGFVEKVFRRKSG